MQKNYVELCRFLQKYAFSGRIATNYAFSGRIATVQYSTLFRHAPRREPNSSPRHEGACPSSTLGGGVLSKSQMCV